MLACTQTPVLFPAPSIFGPSGFGFGSSNSGSLFGASKCQQVPASTLAPAVSSTENPQWTCGVIVDGSLSCQQSEWRLVWCLLHCNKAKFAGWCDRPTCVCVCARVDPAVNQPSFGGCLWLAVMPSCLPVNRSQLAASAD